MKYRLALKATQGQEPYYWKKRVEAPLGKWWEDSKEFDMRIAALGQTTRKICSTQEEEEGLALSDLEKQQTLSQFKGPLIYLRLKASYISL